MCNCAFYSDAALSCHHQDVVIGATNLFRMWVFLGGGRQVLAWFLTTWEKMKATPLFDDLRPGDSLVSPLWGHSISVLLDNLYSSPRIPPRVIAGGTGTGAFTCLIDAFRLQAAAIDPRATGSSAAGADIRGGAEGDPASGQSRGSTVMVFESLVSDLLNRFIGDYVENLDKSQLKIGIWGGERSS